MKSPSPILLHWSGPYTIDQIEQHNKAEDYGLYMIVVLHIVQGPETLLYGGNCLQPNNIQQQPKAQVNCCLQTKIAVNSVSAS